MVLLTPQEMEIACQEQLERALMSIANDDPVLVSRIVQAVSMLINVSINNRASAIRSGAI